MIATTSTDLMNLLKDKKTTYNDISLKGNKGEWSELYVFFKLILDESIYIGDAANSNIKNKKTIGEPNTLKVHGVSRTENGITKTYQLKENKNKEKQIFINDENGKYLGKLNIPYDTLKETILKFANTLKFAKKKEQLDFVWLKNTLIQLQISKIKSESSNKQDIKLILYDALTKQYIYHGFSIKSEIGAPATLLNPSSKTKFYYEITPNILGSNNNSTPTPLDQNIINDINNIVGAKKYQRRIKKIQDLGYNINFNLEKTTSNSPTFTTSLMADNIAMPELIAKSLFFSFEENKRKIPDILDYIKTNNILNIPYHEEVKFYERNLKTFLINTALGMMPGTFFDGTQDASGGYLVLKDIDDIVGYFNNGTKGNENLKNYLIQHTKIETPSNTESNSYGQIEYDSINNKYYFSLSLQIRFMKQAYFVENVIENATLIEEANSANIPLQEVPKFTQFLKNSKTKNYQHL